MMTPQDNARSSYSQAHHNPPRHLFQSTPNLPTPSSSRNHQQHQHRPSFRLHPGGLTQVALNSAGLRQQRQSSYTTPYAPTDSPAALSRQHGNHAVVSAEQQIAQGVLSNSSPSMTNQSQSQPPPLGTTIHMPPHSSPSSQSMSLHHAMNPQSAPPQRDYAPPRQPHPTSPSIVSLALQREAVNSSPANSSLCSTPQVSPANTSQDMSMIDPQLAAEQQAHEGDSLLDSHVMERPEPDISPVVHHGEMLSAPPGGTYPTFDALFTAAQAHALAHGYAFVIGRSKRDNRGLKKVFLICDRGGTNKEKVPGEQRQRKTKSRKCGCEFGVFGLENKVSWVLRGRMDGEHLVHNHEPSESPTEHPGARKLDPKAIAAVKALEESGVSVKETLEILHRENPSVRFLPRDIYNARAAIKRDPSRVEPTVLESLPTFYKKPPLTFEEKLRAELRTEVAKAQSETDKVKLEWQKEVEDLKEQLRQKDKQIQKFEMFIDICNERVMVQRERLAEGENGASANT